MVRNLLLIGGVYHPFEESAPALAAVLEPLGWRSDICFDIEAGLARLAAGEFDQLTVACLRWTMIQNEKYAPFRQEFALSLSPAGRAAIRDYVAAGNGLLGIHGAPISFDDWPEWPGLLGIGWRWGISHHPPYCAAEVRMAGDHPITHGLPGFNVSDEIYSALDVAPFMAPLAEARHADMDWRPVAFAGEKDGARRAWCGLGHDAASLAEPTHGRLIRRAAQWVRREPLDARGGGKCAQSKACPC